MRVKTSMPAATKLYNLEQYISQDGKERKEAVIAYQIPYGMAKGLKHAAENRRHMPGTFFKIV